MANRKTISLTTPSSSGNTVKKEEFLSDQNLLIEVRLVWYIKYIFKDVYFENIGHSECFCCQFMPVSLIHFVALVFQWCQLLTTSK